MIQLFIFLMWAFPLIPFKSETIDRVTTRYHQWLLNTLGKSYSETAIAPEQRRKWKQLYERGHKIEPVATAAYVMMLAVNGPDPSTIKSLDREAVAKVNGIKVWFEGKIKAWMRPKSSFVADTSTIREMLALLDWIIKSDDKGIARGLVQGKLTRYLVGGPPGSTTLSANLRTDVDLDAKLRGLRKRGNF